MPLSEWHLQDAAGTLYVLDLQEQCFPTTASADRERQDVGRCSLSNLLSLMMSSYQLRWFQVIIT
jgi:hypothetical protein